LILVTGAAGFIGSRVAEMLLERGDRVFGVDNMNDYYDVALKHHRLQFLHNYSSFEFAEVDIECYDKLESIFKKNEISKIINLAARAGVRASIENPFIYSTTNINGTLNLLELAKLNKIEKFILASSSSLYAGEKTPFTEDMPVNNPISPYAASKKAAELFAYTYYQLYNISSTVLRFFTVFGPAGRPDMSYYQFIRKIYSEQPIEVFGDGKQTRDFTYIDDIARGVILSLNLPNYDIINLGGGKKPISINYMIQQIEELLMKKANIIYKDFNEVDMLETSANITKAQNILNWTPNVEFEVGIRHTIDWFLNNKALHKVLS